MAAKKENPFIKKRDTSQVPLHTTRKVARKKTVTKSISLYEKDLNNLEIAKQILNPYSEKVLTDSTVFKCALEEFVNRLEKKDKHLLKKIDQLINNNN